MVLLYHERQVAALCGQHCLNNLLQGFYFTEWDLAEIAQELDRTERALLEPGAAFESSNVSLDGNFSIQVLSAALQRGPGGCVVSLEDTRRPENRNYMYRPETQEAFVLNRSAHWYCMRKIDGTWWQMNSTQPAPERLGDRGLGSVLAELAADNWTIFLVKGKLPTPMSRSSGVGDPKNWVDPANPPPADPQFGGASPFGNAAPKREEPKFQAFTGSGQRLGGGSTSAPAVTTSGGGASAAGEAATAALAGKSEDEQLAIALAMSSQLANKARLEARLLPEPETGAGAARLAVRMPDGGRLMRRFPADAPLYLGEEPNPRRFLATASAESPRVLHKLLRGHYATDDASRLRCPLAEARSSTLSVCSSQRRAPPRRATCGSS